MSQLATKGISRQGLDVTFEMEESRKSALILEARLLREQRQYEKSAARFAEAAEIEERLSDACRGRGLHDKSYVHRFSAASCWAQAGDFFHAIMLCDSLLARDELPTRLRSQIQEYLHALRLRRDQWYESLVLDATGTDG